ncbi:MAG: hypothetical protein U0531_06755 [Dehalococcoidia bacterium]
MIDVLAEKTARAAQATGASTGAARRWGRSNSALRRAIAAWSPVAVRVPPPTYCTDNAVMIAGCAFFHLAGGERSGLDLDVQPNLRFKYGLIDEQVHVELPGDHNGARVKAQLLQRAGAAGRRSAVTKVQILNHELEKVRDGWPALPWAP